ncbi:MAG: AlbA family DNA-binding domain-containing protein [Halobacteriota archaeon]
MMFIETLGLDSSDLNERRLLERVILPGREEGKKIDYKREFSFACGDDGLEWKGDKDSAQYEFLKDVSSFANTSGGVIFYGVRERGGIPQAMNLGAVIPKNAVETIENHLDALIRDHTQPHVTVGYHHIPLESGKEVYLLIIPKSWTGPHQVCFKQQGKPVHKEFWARSDAKRKYQLGVGQLRDAFLRTKTLASEIEQFKADRIKFVSDLFISELPLDGKATTLLHLIPVNAFDIEREQYDLSSVFRDNNVLKPMSRMGDVGFPGPDPTIQRRFNFDGVMKWCYYRVPKKEQLNTPTYLYPYTYTQLFTNGIVEASERIALNAERPLTNSRQIDMDSFERRLIDTLDSYVKTLQNLNVMPSIFLFLTLNGIRGYEISRRHSSTLFGGKVDRNKIEVATRSIDAYDVLPETILKPCFDSIWNACGYPASLNYDKDGNYDTKGSDQRLQELIDKHTAK